MLAINSLYNDDAFVILSKIDDKSVDLIFADPPYNIGQDGKKVSYPDKDYKTISESWDSIADYNKFSDDWIAQSNRILKNTGSIYVCASMHNISEVIVSLKKSKFTIKNIITWIKSNPFPNVLSRSYKYSSEFIVFAVKDKNWIFNSSDLKKENNIKNKDGTLKQMSDVWTFPICGGKERIKLPGSTKSLHPSQKPELLVKRAIIASSNKGSLVLDPFSGSGTTCAVAKKLERNWIGIEANKTYYDAACSRITKIGDK